MYNEERDDDFFGNKIVIEAMIRAMNDVEDRMNTSIPVIRR